MLKMMIKLEWRLKENNENQQPLPKLLALLAAVHQSGNLVDGCKQMGLSYRHAWGLLKESGQTFGAPLVTLTRGQGTKLTPLGEKLLWADKRISARLTPILDSLASEIEVEIARTLSNSHAILRAHASHGFAVETLRNFLVKKHIPIELKYMGSVEAVASLSRSSCELAGFHVPIGELEIQVLESYAKWLKPRTQRLINLASRRQGIMVATGNPRGILSLADLAQPRLRFVNRQLGSGTRVLLDLLLKREKLDGRRIGGYENTEFTHAAVAAFIASGMADAGFGVETAARQFNLGFIPIVSERYFLICYTDALTSPVVRQVVEILQSKQFKAAVNNLPGYDASATGIVMSINEAFPDLPPAKKRNGITENKTL